jgi:hypothetical protein
MKRILIVIVLLSAMRLQAQNTSSVALTFDSDSSANAFIKAFDDGDSLYWTTYIDPSPNDTTFIDSKSDSLDIFIKNFFKNYQLKWATFYGFNDVDFDKRSDIIK